MAKLRDYGTTKDVVTRLVDEAGGVKRVAHLMDCSAAHVYAQCDPARDENMSFDAVRKITEFCGSTAAVEDLAALAHGVYMPIEPSEDALHELSAKSAKEHGELLAALMRAAADGAVDGCEAREILRECDQHLRAVVALRAKLVALVAGSDA